MIDNIVLVKIHDHFLSFPGSDVSGNVWPILNRQGFYPAVLFGLATKRGRHLLMHACIMRIAVSGRHAGAYIYGSRKVPGESRIRHH